MKSLIYTGAGLVLASALVAAQAANPNTAKLMNPSALTEQAPATYTVNLNTTKGLIAILVHRDWAPIGVDHFYSLVKLGYYDGNRFFRVTRSYAQFGINGDPNINGMWSMSFLPDDPVKQSNVKGTLTYAHLGANNRSTQLCFNLRDNKDLDKAGFAPIGKISAGMDVMDRLYSSYGDMPPRGQGPDPSKIEVQGNSYLESRFPRLDFIRRAAIQ